MMLARVTRRAHEAGVQVLAYSVDWQARGRAAAGRGGCKTWLLGPGWPWAWQGQLATARVRRWGRPFAPRPPLIKGQGFNLNPPCGRAQGGRAFWGRALPVTYGDGVAAADVDAAHLERVLEFNATDPRTHWKAPSPGKAKAGKAKAGGRGGAAGAEEGGEEGAAAAAAGGDGGDGAAAPAAAKARGGGGKAAKRSARALAAEPAAAEAVASGKRSRRARGEK